MNEGGPEGRKNIGRSWRPSWKGTREALGWLYGFYVFAYLTLFIGHNASLWFYTVAPAFIFVGFKWMNYVGGLQILKDTVQKMEGDLRDKQEELWRIERFLESRGLEEEYSTEEWRRKNTPNPYDRLFG